MPGFKPRPMRFYLDPVLPGVRPRVWLRKFAIATRERSSGYHCTVREIFPIIIRFWSGIGDDRWLARMKIRVNENGRAFGNIANDLGMNGGLFVIRMIDGIRRPIVILWTIAFGIGTRLLGRFRVTAFTDGARDYRRVPIRQRSGGGCGRGRCTVRIRARQLRTVPIRRRWQAIEILFHFFEQPQLLSDTRLFLRAFPLKLFLHFSHRLQFTFPLTILRLSLPR